MLNHVVAGLRLFWLRRHTIGAQRAAHEIALREVFQPGAHPNRSPLSLGNADGQGLGVHPSETRHDPAKFYIAGTGTRRVLIRAVGPTIGGAPYNVPGVLLDPKLELYDANAVKIAENDTWDLSLAATFTSVGAFALAPGSGDAALVITLNAGSGYTAQVKGADGGTGEALVEVYELP